MENELERQGDSTQVKRPEDLPQKLVEEIVVHLFCNKAFVLDKELAVKHTPISLFPAPVVRSLFSKCSFYNICMSKILDLTVRNKSLMDRLVAKYVDYDLKLKRLNIVREVENRQKTHFVLYRNEYKIDKREKFVFLDNSSTCVFKDINAFKSCSDFFDVFSSKYPQYFPSYADQIVKQTSSIIDILADSVVDLMKELHGGEEYKERIIIILDDKGEAILDQFRLIDRLYNQQ